MIDHKEHQERLLNYQKCFGNDKLIDLVAGYFVFTSELYKKSTFWLPTFTTGSYAKFGSTIWEKIMGQAKSRGPFEIRKVEGEQRIALELAKKKNKTLCTKHHWHQSNARKEIVLENKWPYCFQWLTNLPVSIDSKICSFVEARSCSLEPWFDY